MKPRQMLEALAVILWLLCCTGGWTPASGDDGPDLRVSVVFDVVGKALLALSGMVVFLWLCRFVHRRVNLPKAKSFKRQTSPDAAAVRRMFTPITPPCQSQAPVPEAPPASPARKRMPSVRDGTPFCRGGS